MLRRPMVMLMARKMRWRIEPRAILYDYLRGWQSVVSEMQYRIEIVPEAGSVF